MILEDVVRGGVVLPKTFNLKSVEKDKESTICKLCSLEFGKFTNRRKNCKLCGIAVCIKCRISKL
jgi:hypothetical protein